MDNPNVYYFLYNLASTPLLLTGDQVYVSHTSSDSPGVVWLQREQDSGVLEELSLAITKHVEVRFSDRSEDRIVEYWRGWHRQYHSMQGYHCPSFLPKFLPNAKKRKDFKREFLSLSSHGYKLLSKRFSYSCTIYFQLTYHLLFFAGVTRVIDS